MIFFGILLVALSVASAQEVSSSDSTYANGAAHIFDSNQEYAELVAEPDEESTTPHDDSTTATSHWLSDYYRDQEGTWKRREPNVYPRELSCPEYLVAFVEDLARENPKIEEILSRNKLGNVVQFIRELLLAFLKSSSELSPSDGDEDVQDPEATEMEVEDSEVDVSDSESVLAGLVTDQDPEHAYVIVRGEDADEIVVDEVPVDIQLLDRSGYLPDEESSWDEPESVCEECPLQAGSIRGIPGKHFPNYEEIPITSFSCAGKRIPGFYADLETGCQTFHVCWPHRRESFLCPVGTTFNQPILACDYWYSSNCSLAPHFFEENPFKPETPSTEVPKPSTDYHSTKAPEFTTHVPSTQSPEHSTHRPVSSTESSSSTTSSKPVSAKAFSLKEWLGILEFLPVKVKVVQYPEETRKDKSHVIKSKPGSYEDTIVSNILRDLLKAAVEVSKDAERFIAKIVAEKAMEKSRNKAQSSTAKPVIKQAPKIDPKFVVRPATKIRKQVSKPVVTLKPAKYLKIHSDPAKVAAAQRVTAGVLRTLAAASKVLQEEISPLTRQMLIKNYSNLS